MDNFDSRYARAQPWEAQLVERLRSAGWLAAPFGQALIPEDMRRHLSTWRDSYGRPTLIRWMPDVIAAHPARRAVCLLDAKTEHSDTAYYAVEVHAVEGGLSIVQHWNTPVFYIWPDGGVMTPALVANRWHRRLDGQRANGSGTSFYLVSKAFRLSAVEALGLEGAAQ